MTYSIDTVRRWNWNTISVAVTISILMVVGSCPRVGELFLSNEVFMLVDYRRWKFGKHSLKMCKLSSSYFALKHILEIEFLKGKESASKSFV